MTLLGLATDRKTGEKGPLDLSAREREQSTYIIGTTGTGKTTLLRNVAVQDMWNLPDDGLCVLDPHGDLTDELLGWVPAHRIDDVVFLNPRDTDWPFGLNLLACDRSDEHQVRWVVDTVLETLHRLFWYSWGPRLEHVLHHTIRTAMTIPGSTFVELLLLLTSRDYRDEIVGMSQAEPGRLDPERDFLLVNFWHEWFFKLGSHLRTEVVSSTLNKLSPFLLDSMMRNIIGQAENSVDIRDLMDEGKILLVNLSKGDIGENNSALLGSVLINLILIAALRRREAEYRRPFHVVVDEYQNFANASFAILQSEARKFGVDLIVAHQYRDQLDADSQGSSLNVGNIICFRVSGRDAYLLASQFDNTPPPPDPVWEAVRLPSDQFPGLHQRGQLDRQVPGLQRPYRDVEAETANSLSTLNDYRAMCRLIRRPQKGVSHLGEYELETDEWPQVEGEWSEEVRRACIEQSREKYGRNREAVETAIYKRTGGRIQQVEVPAYIYVDAEE
jgi:hypothetical protein